MIRSLKFTGSLLILLAAIALMIRLLAAAGTSSAMTTVGQSPLATPYLPICNAPWPTPPALACPWLPTPSPQPTSLFPTPTPWEPPKPPAQIPTPLPLVPAVRDPAGTLIYRANSFQGRNVDRRGGVAQVAQRLNLQPPVEVAPDYDYFARFDRLVPAPGGKYAAAVAAVESGDVVDIVDLATGQSRWLYWLNTEGESVGAEGVFYGWHPNGYEFLFREDNAPDRGLWLVDARTGEHRLVAQPLTMDISGAAISPDGQRLVYATNTFDVHQIWAANADGSEPRLLLESDTIVYVFSWSPDGRYVLYVGEPSVTNTDAAGPLWVMDREGQNRRSLRLPFVFGFGFEPVWSPVGYQVAAVGATQEPISCWQSGDAFLSDPLCRYRGTGVYVETVGAGKAQLVVRNAIDPAWSPDGSLLAVSRMDDREQVDIWLVNRDGRGLRRVMDTPEVDRRPVWLAREGAR